MSRIGVKPITIPSGVTVAVEANKISVAGPKGTLFVEPIRGITVKVVENQVVVTRSDNTPKMRAYHGLVRNLIYSHIVGVTDGYKKTLKMVGTGYRVAAKGKGITLSVGFSHPVEITALEGTKITVEGNDTIHVEGADKQKVGQLSADIRKIRPPEPYKGKGIRYIDEEILRKVGKTASK
jgi:large subunit ribosomal protein L6